MTSPIRLAYAPDWSQQLWRELHIIARALPENGLWASYTSGEGPWNKFITSVLKQIMKFQPNGKLGFLMTKEDIARTDNGPPENLWMSSLYSVAIMIRHELIEMSALSTFEDPTLILMMPKETVILTGTPDALSGTPSVHLYIPSPELTGHELMDGQRRLDEAFPGRFHIESVPQ